MKTTKIEKQIVFASGITSQVTLHSLVGDKSLILDLFFPTLRPLKEEEVKKQEASFSIICHDGMG